MPCGVEKIVNMNRFWAGFESAMLSMVLLITFTAAKSWFGVMVIYFE